MASLEGKVALVTGSSRGIGRATAIRLAQEGAELIVHYSQDQQGVEQTANIITALGAKVTVVRADLGSKEGPGLLFSQLSHTNIHILVNNAGMALSSQIAEMRIENFDRLADLNMRGVFFVTQQALQLMPDGGRIINVSSVVSRTFFSSPGLSVYAASKGFVDVLTRHLAGELAVRNITVNAVAPGAIDTAMNPHIHGTEQRDFLKNMQALPGIGQPEFIANVIAFLSGHEAGWITGQIVDVSGGSCL